MFYHFENRRQRLAVVIAAGSKIRCLFRQDIVLLRRVGSWWRPSSTDNGFRRSLRNAVQQCLPCFLRIVPAGNSTIQCWNLKTDWFPKISVLFHLGKQNSTKLIDWMGEIQSTFVLGKFVLIPLIKNIFSKKRVTESKRSCFVYRECSSFINLTNYDSSSNVLIWLISKQRQLQHCPR